MIVFLDFEASSLSNHSYPIEVGWVFEDGREETHLIRPAPGWTDWDEAAQGIHHIARQTLIDEGEPHDVVARRMVEQLTGHDLRASAPSWDGKWLSALLRRRPAQRALTLKDSDDAHVDCATRILRPVVPAEKLKETVETLLALTEFRDRSAEPAHRALPDAREEMRQWHAVGTAARALAAEMAAGGAGIL